jgi:hypothetical protein
MSCAQCFLLVSKDCPHCRELIAKAKDAVELLSRRGLLVVNIEDFPDLTAADVYEVKDGDLRLAIPTPQLVCLAKTDTGWVKLYQYVVKSPEEFYEARRFFEAKLHMLKLQFGRTCFETRGRKKRGEKEDQEPEGRRRGRRGRS